MKVICVIAAACFPFIAHAEEIKLANGQIVKGDISRVEPDGLVVMTDEGITKVLFRDLPKDAAARYGYNPQAEQRYQSQRAVNSAVMAKQKARDQARYGVWVAKINALRQEASFAPSSVAQSGGTVESGEARKRKLLAEAAGLEQRLVMLQRVAQILEEAGRDETWVTDMITSAMSGRVFVGMPAAAALAAVGTPKKINRTLSAGGPHEQWVYENGYIYVEDGFVRSIQD